MRIGRIAITGLMLVGILITFSRISYAQGSNLGTIRGTVTDANGAVLPNATVQVTDLATGLSRDITTNGEGNYEVVALKPGTYKVTVTATGFKTTNTDAVVSGSDTVRADLKLEVGAQTESVVVVGGEAGVIEKDQPVISSMLDNRQLTGVPRDSREILEFLYLNPDITQGPGGDGTFKFIGSQSYGASFSLDGQRTNGGIFGEPTSSQPSLETIGELIVLSKNFSAEYSGIANVRIETKRGGADYHGSLFYNNKNSALAAWTTQDKIDKANFFPTPALSSFPTPYFNLNETGGSLSGPVPFSRKHTFFLLSYERRWDFAPVRVRAFNIPTSLILGGNFTALNATSRPAVAGAVEPLLTPTELANNTILTGTRCNEVPRPNTCTLRFNSIPTRLLNPVALSIVNGYYPHSSPSAPFSPTTGRLTDFAQSFGGLLTRDLATLRVDHDFSDKDKFYAVYNFQSRNGNRGLVANPLPAFGLLSQHQSNHTLSLSYTRIFSNSFVNELRGGINYQLLYRRANLKTGEWLSSVGFTDAEINSYGSVVGPSLVDTPGQVAFVFGGFPGIPNGGRNTDRPMDQKLSTFGDTISWTVGNHAIRAGGDIVRNQAVDGFALNRNNPRGAVNYANNLGGFANFLIGLPPASVTFVRDVRPALDVSNWEHGYFINDDYKIHDRLTLTLGLRYEVHTPFVDKNNLMVNFDPNGTGNGGRKGRFVVPTADVISRIHPFFVNYGVVTADDAGVGRGLVKTDKNNFAPRVGAAWRLTENSVLRGGFGIFYPTSAAQGIRDAIATNTFNQRITKRNTLGLPGGINPRGITPFSGGTVSLQGIAANAIPFGIQDPRFEQYNVTYENEFMPNTGFRVSYIGGRQHGLIAGFDLNELAPSTTPFGITNEDGDRCDPLEGDCVESPADEARRPFPNGLGDFLATYGNTGKGRSHALQFEVNRRFARGFMFNASYTLLDQKSSGVDVGNSSLGGALYNQFNPTNDLSRDSFVSRHRFVSYGAYDLPFGRGREYGRSLSKWEDALVGGFQISWNMFAKSGTGFTPYWTCNNCGPVFPGNIASGFVDAVGDFSGPSFRPTITGNPYASLSGDQIFNPGAFGLPPTGADVFDNPAVAKRNSLVGPGTWGVNMGFKKFFSFSEQTRLEVGVDFNNIFNHPLLSPLDIEYANLGDFAVSLNAAGQPVILPENVNPNPDFGRQNNSFTQEGIDNRRSVRLKLRLTF